MGGARGGTMQTAAMVSAVVLLVAAVLVRGMRGEPAVAPQDRPREFGALVEPLQLLGRGAGLRIGELEARVSQNLRGEWRDVQRAVFELRGCPGLVDWLDTADGQRCERLLGELRRGSRDDSLAALALTMQLARVTEWDPGLLARLANAERLGSLLQEWLHAWGERGSEDATLAQPTLAAALCYGRVMRIAAEAPPVGRYDAPYERARAFLASALLDQHGQSTALGRALRARFPVAANGFDDAGDCLAGFDREAAQLFPGFEGECDE